MDPRNHSRREIVLGGLAAAVAGREARAEGAAPVAPEGRQPGAQRLPIARLQAFEALGYGMFIHFGMSTFDGDEYSKGQSPATLYAPTALDVDQWVSVARDAGMRYAILTAKHVAGHCLWPSRHTRYTVEHSADRTDVCGRFVQACRARGVLPGFYYCSWDNHHRFGSRTPSDEDVEWGGWGAIPTEGRKPSPFTTSTYQTFQTLQLTELLTQFGPIAETWIDIPGVLGPGYREFLYHRIAQLQPETVVMMNNGLGDGERYDADYAWPSDLIALERGLPRSSGHRRWRTIGGREYYLPGEVCEPIGKHWFFVEGDEPKPQAELVELLSSCRQRGVNLLLDVPPDRRGRIPEASVEALMRLRRAALP